ncbi:hypothetical protein [Actinomadura sp. WMMB 499]|uniref:hypothetical protein n=1 Tax=Actinomadura sp. WMMB 499 TaxID=1219491 RepID=UPI001246689D|nr:hypothetical protein [Actinomadura sp. WMMB 499]QFG24971.1 hypothetical protein F7P10_31405 [Actinomadura sp. WMMB 499]
MISGHDSVLVCAGPVAERVGGFVDALADASPSLLVAVDEGGFVPWDGRTRPPSGAAELLVARDAEMVDRWDRDGYHLDRDGHGTLMIAYEPCRAPRLDVTVLDDPYGRGGFLFDPYDVTLIGAGLSLVTVVTPDADGPFARSVLDGLAEHLAGAAPRGG